MTEEEVDAPELFDTLLAGVASSPPIAPRAPLQKLGHFALLRELGQGGFGVVFEAEDERDRSRVALKLLRNEHPEWIYRFKREFRSLADLTHENLVRLDELTSDAGRWYFTMELVRGAPFLEAVRAKPERLTHAFADLARGMSALHEAGKLHRDVKPSNVLVDERGRAVLLDFGLAMDLSQDQSAMMAGTPYYMSPEQHGYAELTPASDWYALGVILYEALAGRGPFEGSIVELVAQKRAGRVRPPSELVADVPPALEALCLALLSVDPKARPSGAAILELLGGEAAPESRAEPMPAELFVGRALELAALRTAFDDGRQGPVLALLAGASGMGKSAILRQFVDSVRRELPAAVVLSGRCYEREAVPYKAMDGVIDELGRMLGRMPRTEVAALLPRDAAALGQLFPVLRQIEAVNSARTRAAGDRNEQRRRGMEALRELLARISDRQPLLIAVDDLQWGDADSVALMAELLRPPDPPGLLFVGVFRAEERRTSPLLSGLQDLRGSTLSSLDVREIQVGELAPEDATELVSSLLGQRRSNNALAERITAEAQGCPFLVHELVQQRGDDGAPSTRVEEALQARMAKLDVPTRRLLEVVALCGEPIERSIACAAAELQEQMRLTVATLRSEHLIRTREIGGAECIEPYHDRIRQAVLGGVSGDGAARLHRQIAAALEQSGQAAPERIARHLAGAGAFERAAELMLVAARSAAEALAFDHAASLLRQVLDLRDRQPDSSSHDRRELLCELGDALVEAGKGAEAADVYISAARGADEYAAFELKRKAADQLLQAGHMERGREVLAALLSTVGLRLPATSWSAALEVLPQRARLKLRGLSFVPRDESRIAKRDLQRIDVLLGAVFGYLSGDPPTAFFLGAELVRRALDAGEPRRVLDALALESFLRCMMGSDGESAREAMVTVARQVGTPAAHHTRLTTEGGIASLQGRWKQALRSYDEADAWGREHGTRSPLFGTRALFFRFDALYWTGQVDTAARGLPPLIQDLHDRGDIMGWMWMSLIWGWVTCCRGKPDEAREIVDHALRVWGKGGVLPHWWRMFNDVNFALYEGDGNRARELLSHSPIQGIRLRLVGREGRVQFQWACARAAIAAAARRSDNSGLIDEAEKSARSVGRQGSPIGGAIEPSLLAAIAALRGQRSEAIALLEDAEHRLRAVDMEMMVASVQRARGQLGTGERASRASAESELWMSQQKIAEPARFAAMYLPGPW